jgi:GST-like protein
MITLYAADTANSGKIFLALEEMELPYEAVPVDLLRGAQFEPSHLRLNPNAKIPVIVDEDGPDGRRHVVFESGAILLYLAEKTGKFLSSDPVERSTAIQWLMLQMSSVGPMLGQFIHFARFAPSDNQYALARYRAQVLRVVDVLDGQLAQNSWLGGENYSVADIATFPWARALGGILDVDVEKKYKNIWRWTAQITLRPASERADAAKAALASHLIAPDKASPDALDRLFGRGESSK